MLRLTDVIQLKPGEEVHAVARRHSVTLWPKLFLSGVLIVAPFFFLFTLTHWGAAGMALFAVSVAAGLLLAARTFHIWDADVLLVTSHRLVDVDQRGLWTRVVSEAPLAFVQDVRCVRRGVGEAICRMGTLVIKTSGSAPEIIVPKIPRPERLIGLINDLRSPHQPQVLSSSASAPSDPEPLKRVHSLIDHADPATLAAIEAVLKEKQG